MSQLADIRSSSKTLLALIVAGVVGWEAFEWTVNRISVPVGSSLLLQYKGPLLFGSRNVPKNGQLASLERGEVGVIEQMPGPGRHFYCPIWWECRIVEDQVVAP